MNLFGEQHLRRDADPFSSRNPFHLRLHLSMMKRHQECDCRHDHILDLCRIGVQPVDDDETS